MYGIAITYAVASLLLLGWVAYITFKMTSRKLAVLMKFAFMSADLYSIMQISFFAKVVLFLTLYCISDLSIKNNILRKVINRANRAKKV